MPNVLKKTIICGNCGKDSVNTTIYRDPLPNKSKMFEVGILLDCKHKQMSYYTTDRLDTLRDKLQRQKEAYGREFDKVQQAGVK